MDKNDSGNAGADGASGRGAYRDRSPRSDGPVRLRDLDRRRRAPVDRRAVALLTLLLALTAVAAAALPPARDGDGLSGPPCDRVVLSTGLRLCAG